MRLKKIFMGWHDRVLVAGIALGTVTAIQYAVQGIGLPVIIGWWGSIMLCGLYFWLLKLQKKYELAWGWKDIAFLLVLLAIFVPIYLSLLANLPVQMNADEINVTRVVRTMMEKSEVDPFGISWYLGFPNAVFLFMGHIGTWLGGITVTNMRIFQASFGIVVILCGYLFFRILTKSPWFAFTASVILGSNHSLLGVSRTAMRENIPTALELLALSTLYMGVMEGSLFYAFLSGVISGLAFYGYFPGRIIPVICVLFLSILWLTQKKRRNWHTVLLCCMMFFGIVLSAGPVVIATVKEPTHATGYMKAQLLIFPEGRDLQQRWFNAATPLEGVEKNIISGITLFTAANRDEGWIYTNQGFGFTGPLLGTLIWLGFLYTAILLWRKYRENDAMIMTGFGLLFFVFTFIVNKSPDFTRLLIILPFAAYFAARCIWAIAEKMKGRYKRLPWHSFLFSGCMLAAVLAWNLNAYFSYIRLGWEDGNDLGSSAQYVVQRSSLPGYSYYLAYDDTHPFYGLGGDWYSFFISKEQNNTILTPDQLLTEKFHAPFTIFLSRKLYDESKDKLAKMIPPYVMRNIVGNGSMLALEVR